MHLNFRSLLRQIPLISCILFLTSCITTQDSYQENRVRRLVGRMSLEEQVGQLFMLTLRVDAEGQLVKEAVTEKTPLADSLLSTFRPGGLVLYAENIVTIPQTRQLIQSLQYSSRIPLLIAVDEEGGIVSRIGKNPAMHATSFPPNGKIVTAGDPHLAYLKGRILGRELSALGFNVAFSTIADLFTNPRNTVIGSRAYGSDPELAGKHVSGEVRGIQEAGVLPVLKHFPGHGDTFEDSHVRLATVRHDRKRLDSTELLPFRRGIESGAGGVMTGHIAVPEVTGNMLPATFSRTIIEDILRRDLGFNGIVFTDALEMRGASLQGAGHDRAVMAFLAGADILLAPIRPLQSYQAVLEAVRSGLITEERLQSSVCRILKAKAEIGILYADTTFEETADPEKVLGNPQHKADRIRIETAITAQSTGEVEK